MSEDQARHQIPLRWILLGCLATFALLVGFWPSWTLSYTRALAWPLVALAAILILAPRLAEKIEDLLELELPWMKSKFKESSPPVQEPLSEIPEPTAAAEDTAAEAAEAARVFGFINGAFQLQLDFLRHLRDAADGLSHDAARSWFTNAISNSVTASTITWDVDGLIRWLIQSEVVTLGTDGNYRLLPRGEVIVHFIFDQGYAYAPKLY